MRLVKAGACGEFESRNVSPDVLSCKLSPKILVRKMKREAAGFRKMVHVAWVLVTGWGGPRTVSWACCPGVYPGRVSLPRV